MRGADGRLLGILSVDEPISGRKPSGDEIDVLVAVSEHAALAVQTAQEATRAKANRDALERLLAVSASLNESSRHERAPAACVRGDLRGARLREGRRAAARARTACTRRPPPSASPMARTSAQPLTADELERLLQPEFDIAGCFLIPHEAARRLLPDRPAGYRSQRDGRGPHAWQNDWLFVPLHDRRAPAHRLHLGRRSRSTGCAPTPERLQILRAFANQATTALEQASQFEEIQNAYEHHRALIDASPVAIVDFELDGRVRVVEHAARRRSSAGPPRRRSAASTRPCPRASSTFFLDNMARIARGETMRDLDVRRLHRDGSLIDVSISAGADSRRARRRQSARSR